MKDLVIQSKDNAVFKNLKTLLTAKGIKEQKSFFLMGEKLVQEYLVSKDRKYKIKSVVGFEQNQIRTSLQFIQLSKDLFNELDVVGTHSPMLILDFTDFPTTTLSEEPKGLELILPLGDPRNLGALVRTAVGFGVSKSILTKEACHPFLPHAMKASAGAVLVMNFYVTNQTHFELNITGTNAALDLKGQLISNYKWPRNLRLWVGEEGPGLKLSVEQKKKMDFLSIPTTQVESLNATLSASIAIWEWKKGN